MGTHGAMVTNWDREKVQDPPRHSTILASPTTNQTIPDYSPVLPPQSKPTILEDSYDRMCGGVQAPIHNTLPDNVEVGSGANNHGKYYSNYWQVFYLTTIFHLLLNHQSGSKQKNQGDIIDEATEFLNSIDTDSLTLQLDSDSASDGKFLHQRLVLKLT